VSVCLSTFCIWPSASCMVLTVPYSTSS
jgi:hypothetical protein